MSFAHFQIPVEMRGKKEEEDKEEEEQMPLIPSRGDERKSRVGRIDWCDCKKCVRMPTEDECYCCHEDEKAWMRVLGGVDEEERRPLNCIVEHPFFTTVCLNPYALRCLYNRDIRIFEDDDRAPLHEKYRITSFRAFVEFFHGHLEEDVAGPIPACAAATIRGVFPKHAFLLHLPGYSAL